ncbi:MULTISPECIES: TdeIII family type II restriction endonuclease [unclassified Microcoleus]|uniref:TdeIII family type II restriction endonuclease n=1 Tax=unclassified Microcoleus TaxID=2642155 RepID=UPI0025EAFD9A|nr:MULTISPECIES: TdeIII family type II restriction endonuclease [unclassified Microcoleus]
MSAISSTTRVIIKAYLEVFIENLVNEYRGRLIPKLDIPAAYLSSPSSTEQSELLQAAIVPSELLRINEFEIGFSRLSTTYEECAKLIALEHHKEAHRSYEISGEVSIEAVNEIERQIALFEQSADKNVTKPGFEKMIEAVLEAQKTNHLVRRSVKADLYVLSHDGRKFFFEIKGSKPNKGQCLEVIQRLLRYHLLCGQSRPDAQSYYAMAYNPYGPNRSDYKWSVARKYTPFEQAVIMGHEFWNIIGGETAYEELLDIYQEVGREKGKHMLDALAFGF